MKRSSPRCKALCRMMHAVEISDFAGRVGVALNLEDERESRGNINFMLTREFPIRPVVPVFEITSEAGIVPDIQQTKPVKERQVRSTIERKCDSKDSMSRKNFVFPQVRD
jgi:hypothetical protein